MDTELLNKTIFATFDPKDREIGVEDCIGFYAFRHLDIDEMGPLSVLVYGMHVLNRSGRVILDYAGGDPPSAKAGLALDLHQAASAIVRTDALKLKERVAFYIDDAGKLARSSSKAFWSDRAATVTASMSEADGKAIYEALTDRNGMAPHPAAPAL